MGDENQEDRRQDREIVEGGLHVEVDYDQRINLHWQRCGVPVVKMIRLRNDSDRALDHLSLAVSLEPGGASPYELEIGRIQAGATHHVHEVDLSLDEGVLSDHEVGDSVELIVDVCAHEQLVVQKAFPLEILPPDHWVGLTGLPEMLAAHLCPGHAALDGIAERVQRFLRENTGDPTMDGYAGRDPARVRRMISAVYHTFRALDLTLVDLPDRFEADARRIRGIEEILRDQMATSLDLSLVIAACLERIGLHPLLVLVSGRVAVGAWLGDGGYLPEPATDDASRCARRRKSAGLCLLDPAALTARPEITFAVAEQSGRRFLEDKGRFLVAIDVKAARKRGIQELRLVKPNQGRQGEDATSVPEPTDASNSPGEKESPEISPGEARIERWKSRLLDLSLRNKMLNYRETKQAVPLLCPDIASMEDALALGRELEIRHKPDESLILEGSVSSSPAADLQSDDQAQRESYLSRELRLGRLHTNLTEGELGKRLVKIFRAARMDLREGGANTLYLALGFLSWYENPSAEKQRLAPLVLVPLELTRPSPREPFKLRRADEETRLNITLIHKLEREFGLKVEGLDQLPEDQAGLDIPLIFQRFTQAMEGMDRFEVVERAVVGLFSFTKFLMWRDMEERAETLLQNPIVRCLVAGDDPSSSKLEQLQLPDPKDLDADHPPDDVFTVVDADSSQLAAVVGAGEGKSFVLEGPPGTGKSQTITNLVALCLARGKRVLFVSEKMAALRVVQHRLEAVGLGPYCLELHSNKARKIEVIAQLGQAIEASGTVNPRSWKANAKQVGELRRELNGHVAALHREREIGASFFDTTAELIGTRYEPLLDFDLSQLEDVNEETVRRMRSLVGELSAAAENVPTPLSHPFRAVARAEWSPTLQREFDRCLIDLEKSIDTLTAATARFQTTIGVDGEGDAGPLELSLTELERLDEMAAVIESSPGPPKALVSDETWAEGRGRASELIQHGERHASLRARLASRWDADGLLGLDLDALRPRFERWSFSFFIIAWLMLFGARRLLARALAEGRRKLPPNPEISTDLENALALRGEEFFLQSAHAEAASLLGRFWDGVSTNWSVLGRLLSWCERFRFALDSLSTASSSSRVVLTELALRSPEQSAADNEVSSSLASFRNALKEFRENRDRLADLVAVEVVAAWGQSSTEGYLSRVEARVGGWRDHSTQLRDWCSYQRACDALDSLSLSPLTQAHRRGRLGAEKLASAFERSFGEWWWNTTVDREVELSRFVGARHQAKIGEFRKLDAKSLELSQRRVRIALEQAVSEALENRELAEETKLLRHELKKKRLHLPPRSLFQRIPGLLAKLKPCILMSPLSVAQYLDTSFPPFDLVVFDEASQIPVWDGIGAIARGSTIVVVGDSQQLPPTSFFQGGDDGESEDEEDFVELESILDECVASGLRQHRLLWHYRSRHEDLITFSNFHYYDSSLLTFPCAEAARPDLGLSFRPVSEGFYDRSRTRTNRAEAEAVVADVVRRLSDKKESKRTIGIVTFSQAQQNLVEDLLDEARRAHPAIETFFGEDASEPLFVKNLENVQGDERDVILFSICYGPDKNGKVSMNFGPLNRQGGHRRLNVAITRARQQLVVFSSLDSSQVDLTRTSSQAVRHLKTFLEFAERGPRAIGEASNGQDRVGGHSSFEKALARGLRERGWEIREQVGCSGYRIDLAVVDPDRPERYLLGLECDGANYRSAANARDRDRLRAQVLKSLGWRLVRVWSIDFWLDPDKELDRVERELSATS